MFFFFCFFSVGQFDANITLQNVWGRLQSDSLSIIQCLSDDHYRKIRFYRKLDTGQVSLAFFHSKKVFIDKILFPRIATDNRHRIVS